MTTQRTAFEWAISARRSASASQHLTLLERQEELEVFRQAPPEIYELYLKCLSDKSIDVSKSSEQATPD